MSKKVAKKTKEVKEETKVTKKKTKTTKTKKEETSKAKKGLKINNPNPKKKASKEVEPEGNLSLEIGRISLRDICNLVAEALPSKDYGDAKSGIYIETKYVDDEPMLFMTANSMNVFIQHGIHLQNDIEEGYVIPNGKAFKRIVAGLQSLKDQITISADETDLTIQCGDSYEGTIQHYDANDFIFPPSLEEIQENEVITLPIKFIQEALSKVAFSCSSDMSIPELTGVLIEQEKDKINIVGSDGNRLSYLCMKSKIKNPKSVIVGVKYLSLFNTILKTLDVKQSETLKLYLSDEMLYLTIDNTIVGIQIFAGDYPIEGGYEQFVIDEKDCEITLKLNVESFLDKLDLAVLHNNSSSDPITMYMSKSEFKFTDSEMSPNKFKVEFETLSFKNKTGEDELEVVITPQYLYDVLKCIDSKEVTLSLVNEEGPAIVRPVDIKDSEYVHVFSLN